MSDTSHLDDFAQATARRPVARPAHLRPSAHGPVTTTDTGHPAHELLCGSPAYRELVALAVDSLRPDGGPCRILTAEDVLRAVRSAQAATEAITS